MAILVNTAPSLPIAGYKRLMAVACIAIAGPVAMPAAAQLSETPPKPVSVVVGGDVSYDSNLFRQPSSVKPTSDTITVAYVGLRIDTQQSLQRFQLDITEVMRRYAKSTQLDFDSLDYRGAWLWQVGSRVTGTLSADRKESLVPFESALASGTSSGTSSRNVRVNENRAFTLDAWALGNWHLLLGANQSTQKSDQAAQIQPDFKSVGYEAGVKYAAPSGSSFSAIRRSTSGDYVNQSNSPLLGSGYQQDENELKVNWIATGKSTISGRLTWLDRAQNGAPQRDFSGLAGELNYAWIPTGKLRMTLTAKRDLVPFQDPSGSHIVNNTISLAPIWAITAKTSAHLLASHTTSSFAGTAIGPASGPARNDTLNLIDAGVDWTPVNRLIISIGLLHQVRDSNVPAFAFKDTIARINASYRF